MQYTQPKQNLKETMLRKAHLADDHVLQHRPLQRAQPLLLDHIHHTQQLCSQRTIQLLEGAAEGWATLRMEQPNESS